LIIGWQNGIVWLEAVWLCRNVAMISSCIYDVLHSRNPRNCKRNTSPHRQMNKSRIFTTLHQMKR